MQSGQEPAERQERAAGGDPARACLRAGLQRFPLLRPDPLQACRPVREAASPPAGLSSGRERQAHRDPVVQQRPHQGEGRHLQLV